MATSKTKLNKMPTVLETQEDLKALIKSTPEDQRLHAFFSPRLAKELIVNQPQEYQRRVDRGTVDLYRRAMAAQPSKWRHRQPDNILMFDTKCQMMSGQHRCLAGIYADAIFGAWVLGNQPSGEAKYLDQVRARTIGHTIEMFGHHNAGSVASVAKMFLFWTINESPLSSGKISPDEANEILGAYPEIQEWFLRAKRIKRNEPGATPSAPWLTYIIGRMAIEDQERGEKFSEAIEMGEMANAAGVLLRTWRARKSSNSLAAKVWYHNTAARAWESYLTGDHREKLFSPKDRLLDWASPPKGRA